MTSLKPHIIPRDQHPVSRKLISISALKVMQRLNESGYDAYLVGGGVRDILLGEQPKDFDIATNAHPEQIHKLFKNSRLIGRRFKLVHILFGREIIEVATFRGSAEQNDGKQSEHGMLLRDNVYGTIEEDAVRRDFTINALYYSTKDFSIYDYVNSLEDIQKRQIALIGDPETRYREDPVRMLRAIRFAAKLDFQIEANTKAPIRSLSSLLSNVPAARLFDEILKLFLSGKGVAIWGLLNEFDLLKPLFPALAHTLQHDERAKYYDNFVRLALRNTDQRIRAEKPVTPAFLYAALLWPEIDRKWQRLQEEGVPRFPALHQATSEALRDQLPHISIPKRFTLMMKEIWELQIRLEKIQGKKPLALIEHPRFRAAYDFLLLREQAGEDLKGLGQWWTDFQVKHPVPVSTRKRQGKSHEKGTKDVRHKRQRRRSPRQK